MSHHCPEFDKHQPSGYLHVGENFLKDCQFILMFICGLVLLFFFRFTELSECGKKCIKVKLAKIMAGEINYKVDICMCTLHVFTPHLVLSVCVRLRM